MNKLSHWETPKKDVSISELVGKTIIAIEGMENGSEEVIFKTEDKTYLMYHTQDCCESVFIEDVIGDCADLIGSPILMAEEATKREKGEWESQTWTFYKFATIKGYVTLRWLGESNGWYSEEVDFAEILK